MHPALQRLIRILAECEADRLCAEQKEKGPDAVNVEAEARKIPMKKNSHRSAPTRRGTIDGQAG